MSAPLRVFSSSFFASTRRASVVVAPNVCAFGSSNARANLLIGNTRSFAVRRGHRKRQKSSQKGAASKAPGNANTTTAGSDPAKAGAQSSTNSATTTTSSSQSKNYNERLQLIWNRYASPVRFMPTKGVAPGSPAQRPFSKQEYLALAQRLPFALAILGFMLWEETSPISWIRLSGPSMLPTMSADESEIWAIAPTQTIWRRFLFPPQYQRNDLVGFIPTSFKNGGSKYISCKRIIGLPGDRVRRYGAYVHLYVSQDPVDWGILWPSWTQSTDWGHESRHRPDRDHGDTIVVPQGHVWVEADCPGLGLDSRQLGPIPMSAIRGRIICRLWPLWRSKLDDPLYPKNIRQRPHPIPLDEDTLRLYNVHKLSRAPQNTV